MTADWTAVDAALPTWLREHGLHVFTHHRDDSVRFVPVVDDQGGIYSISFDPVRDGQIVVRAAADHGARGLWARAFRSDDIHAGLREAWSVIDGWIREAGHTRTPYLS